MQTKNQISLTRKTLYGIILLVVILAVFGSGSLPSAQAQEANPGTPTPEVAKDTTVTPTPPETSEGGVQGANCSSPVVLDDQWANGFRLVCQNNFYVLMVDLTNPAIKVEVVAASTGTRTVSSFADSNTIAIINADYQWCSSGAICSQGLTISNGSNPTTYTNISHLCSDAKVRREIGFSQDGRVTIDWWYRFVSDGQARSWCGDIPGSGGGLEQFSYNLVGAGPQFTFDGAFHWDCQYGQNPTTHNCLASGGDVGINGEHFGVGDWWNRYQSAIGYSSDGTVLVLGESNNQTHSMQDVHDIMYQRLSTYGKTLKNAFKFDGGSKAGFWYYNHAYDSTPGVAVPNVIRIQRTNSTCYSLSTNINPGGSGNVSVNTPSNCAQGKYTPGTNVQLNANPNGGYIFSNWSGDASGASSSTTIVMNSNKSITANFTPNTYILNITKSGTGNGTVTSNPSGINCGSTCSASFSSGTVVTLTATPTSPSTFGGWSGAGCSGTGTCTVTMSSAQSVTATFSAPGNPTLTVSKNGTGTGTITSSPAGINCGSTCSYAFASGTVVTLTATPTSPSTFGGWSGAGCSGTGTCTVTMSSAQSVTATFNAPGNQTLTVSKNGAGSGTVTSSPAGINCGSSCSASFSSGTVVTLTATPTSPSTFSGWSGASCSGTGTCTVTMSSAQSVTATFSNACPTITRWKGEYFANKNLSGPPTLCRDDQTVDLDWGMGSPDPSIPPESFSARWTRNLDFATGTYLFHLRHDDGARLYIDDTLKGDFWGTCCVWDVVSVPLSAGIHTIRMEMFENGGAAHIGLWWEPATINGWKGEYYNNETLSGNPAIVRDDPAINFEWESNSPDPMVLPDHFSVRWTRSINFSEGTYKFSIVHDDGARLYVDNNLIFENWCDNCVLTEYVNYYLTTGTHLIKLEMWENSGYASSKLSWQIQGPAVVLSTGSQDGWILESSETSNKGGTLNATATTFNLGDDARDKQYRAILSFNTSSLPDNAVITKVTLKIRKQGLAGTDPFATHGGLKVDIRKPFFGSTAGLVISDFQATASKSAVGTFSATPVSNWYSAILGSAGYPYINLTGTTQFRLRFTKDDNEDNGADYMKFFSGNATASARPTLIIEYTVPSSSNDYITPDATPTPVIEYYVP